MLAVRKCCIEVISIFDHTPGIFTREATTILGNCRAVGLVDFETLDPDIQAHIENNESFECPKCRAIIAPNEYSVVITSS